MTDPRISTPTSGSSLSWGFVAPVLFLCTLPVLLRTAGFDLGLAPEPGPPVVGESEAYDVLRGAFVHTLLEAVAIGVAFMTGLLAVAHYRVAGGVVAPVLALALFYGGVLDLFHILSADRVIPPRSLGEASITFTWAVSRLFNAAILVLGTVAVATAFRGSRPRDRGRFVLSWGVGFGVLAALVVAWMLQAETLPASLHGEGLVTRPWDIPPLALYTVAGGVAIPILPRTERSAFVQAVWLSMLPAIIAQLHMAFGTTVLFDHDFNAAHALKALSYAVPFVGLSLDYRYARRDQLEALAERTEAEVRRSETERRLREVRALARELERSNEELEQFAYIASHDLRAPLRAVSSLTSWLEEDLQDRLHPEGREYISLMRNRVQRLEIMISSLLEFSRVGRGAEPYEEIDTAELVRSIRDVFPFPEGVTLLTGELPVVRLHPGRLRQVFLNLMSNAARFARSEVRVAATGAGDEWMFRVSDDGPGIAPEFHERIWGLFTRLEARDEVEGVGLGLALVKKAVEGWGGRVGLDSRPGEGAAFTFTVPVIPASGRSPAPDAEAAGLDDATRTVPTGRAPAATHPTDAAPEEPVPVESPDPAELLGRARVAVEALDAEWLRELLDRAIEGLPPLRTIQEVLAPLIDEVGELWLDKRIGIHHERLASATIRSVLERIITRSPTDTRGPRIVAATPAGHRHELGLMLAAATASAIGWKVTYLGSDVPLESIARAARSVNADLVALSLVHPDGDAGIAAGLGALREEIPDAAILAGGRAAEGFRPAIEALGGVVITDLGEAARFLADLRAERWPGGGEMESPD